MKVISYGKTKLALWSDSKLRAIFLAAFAIFLGASTVATTIEASHSKWGMNLVSTAVFVGFGACLSLLFGLLSDTKTCTLDKESGFMTVAIRALLRIHTKQYSLEDIAAIVLEEGNMGRCSFGIRLSSNDVVMTEQYQPGGAGNIFKVAERVSMFLNVPLHSNLDVEVLKEQNVTNWSQVFVIGLIGGIGMGIAYVSRVGILGLAIVSFLIYMRVKPLSRSLASIAVAALVGNLLRFLVPYLVVKISSLL